MSERPATATFGPIAWCMVAALLFGASTPATKWFTSHLSPFQIAGLLYAGCALAVSPWALSAPRLSQPATRRQKGYFAGALIFGGVVGPVLLVSALKLASAASVALWLNLETVATALLARFLFREHLHLPTWVGVGLIVVASLLLSSGEQQLPLAAGLVALACLSWGLDNNFTALIGTYTPAQVAFAKGLVGASVNWGVASLIAPPSPASVWTLAQVIFVGALGYGASLVLYVSSAQQLGATRSQLIFSSAPAWGLLLAWLALGEEIRTVQLLAAALMGLALWVWHQERHAHRHTHQAVTHTHWHRHDDGHHSHHPHQQRRTWHSHEHSHRAETHAHSHLPDLHHRHRHGA